MNLVFYLMRSIPLSEETREAWKAYSADNSRVVFIRRKEKKSPAGFMESLAKLGGREQILLNLGSPTISETLMTAEEIEAGKLWNAQEWIALTKTPAAMREHFTDLIPPLPTTFPCQVWVKPPGQHGIGKYKVKINSLSELKEGRNQGWDVQLHIEGNEFRVITVGTTVVQAFTRHGDNENRHYTWLGVTGCPKAVKKIAREAASKLHKNTVLAWDILLELGTNKPYLLEGNSCPGVNTETAARILNEITKQYQERNTCST